MYGHTNTMTSVEPFNQNSTIENENPYGTSATTAPPAPMGPPPGQVLLDVEQPVVWMPAPMPLLGCPPGLEYLLNLDQVMVNQQFDIVEEITSWEVANRYQIKNSLGQQIYYAYEESDACCRVLCLHERPFVMHIVDSMKREVIRIYRPYELFAGCCWTADTCCICCAYTVTIECPPGQTVGHVIQKRSLWNPHFNIVDASFEPILKIRGPSCFCQGACCVGVVNYQLKTSDDKEQIGKISKQWGGLAKEAFSKSDNFSINFPKDLDAKVKACLIGALFLIDFVFYEKDNNCKH